VEAILAELLEGIERSKVIGVQQPKLALQQEVVAPELDSYYIRQNQNIDARFSDVFA
jgi:hypothetical protein